MAGNSFGASAGLEAGGRSHEIFRLDALSSVADVGRLPFSLKILLENLLRNEDGSAVTAEDIEAFARWDPMTSNDREIAFAPARVLMQDFTGVPAVVDLAAMRDAMAGLGGNRARINPLAPAELVIDHSVVADVAGRPDAFVRNAELEFERNRERYAFLRWGQQAFADFKVVPPDTGIVHQVNLEYLARVVFVGDRGQAYPDTLVGTDSHTPMVNGLGVLGWGVGGIEAEAAMLGQPISMLMPKVVGFRLAGELPEGSTATDLVLTVTELLRKQGVVGKFVEFYGPGVGNVPLANRATIGNMSPEYGSTCAIFPIDDETLRYLEFTGRPPELIGLVEAYAKEQGLWHDPERDPVYSETVELDLSTVVPSLAGPRRPQDRVSLADAKRSFRVALKEMLAQGAKGRTGTPAATPAPPDVPVRAGGPSAPQAATPAAPEAATPAAPEAATPAQQAAPPAALQPPAAWESAANGNLDGADESVAETFPASDPPAWMAGTTVEPDRNPPPWGGQVGDAGDRPRAAVSVEGADFTLDHGQVVIAAITSCTNTSNPSVMLAAGLLARNAVERGLASKPWVKTSLAPGSKVVMDYYQRAGLIPYLEQLGFHLVGYGCTTCIGNSGPLRPEISAAVERGNLAVASVLSGNRNFEGRINPDCRMNYLASPPLVVAYALAGSMDVNLFEEPLGTGTGGEPVYLRDIWPSGAEVSELVGSSIQSDMFRKSYAEVFAGDERWNSLEIPTGDTFAWDEASTYVRRPPYFDGMPSQPGPVTDIHGARVLAKLGDSVTTDHISPAGVIKRDSPAGRYLVEKGVEPKDFNSYGARRGNHEVMIRGTFANIRLRNQLAPGTEGGVTVHLPSGEQTTIYEAAMRYQAEGVPLVVLAGKEYGSGSSRDWAAKGPRLLGVRAVLAESYERIHRSNLVGMGVLPLQYPEGESAASLGLTGNETFDVEGLEGAGSDGFPREVAVTVDGDRRFTALVRIDTPNEVQYYRHGGILQYVLRQLRG
ncbi:MAG TPA: aconitate hydratase [Actinomycetes bacterium]|nr:aconitate hydratase [Actinomycetes bacterium]